MILGTFSIVMLFTVGYPSYAERVFRNFSCITYNWNINLTCVWEEPTGYDSGITTDIMWKFGNHMLQKCPSNTKSSCTWGLGGSGAIYNVDPDRTITVCLQLKTNDGVRVSEKECHEVDIGYRVRPAAVSDIEAISTSPLCLNISWIHENTLDPKVYILRLSSAHSDINFEYRSMEDSSTGYYRWREEHKVCNLTHNTRYTISVKTRPLNYDGHQTGYWSSLKTIYKVTPKSVPSRSPTLLPGAYTVSPMNITGFRTITVYWSALPRYLWNGEDLFYVIEVSQMKPCMQQIMHKQQRETFYEFESLSYCSVEMVVWSKNEIDLSERPSKMYIKTQGLRLPRDIFMKATHDSEEVDVSWKSHAIATWMTVYWCQNTPSRSCSSGFYHKTVSSRSNSTSIRLKGFPKKAYIFGVSAESKQYGQVVSSGFQWTDCSSVLTSILRSPKIHFRSFPNEEMMTVSWTFSYCSDLNLMELDNRIVYQVSVNTTTKHYQHLLNGNPRFINLYNILSGEEVCVSITTRLNNSSRLASTFNCYTQGQKAGSTLPVTTVVAVLGSMALLLVIIVLVCVTRKVYVWWRSEISISLPTPV